MYKPKYFTIEELCNSTTAKSKGIDNIPSAETRTNLLRLIEYVLDPLRTQYGKPIKVNSGYRCPALNKMVGGSKTSHHVYGMAADISAGDAAKNRQLFLLAQRMNLPYCQLIDEYGYKWVHISYNARDVRKQILHIN